MDDTKETNPHTEPIERERPRKSILTKFSNAAGWNSY